MQVDHLAAEQLDDRGQPVVVLDHVADAEAGGPGVASRGKQVDEYGVAQGDGRVARLEALRPGAVDRGADVEVAHAGRVQAACGSLLGADEQRLMEQAHRLEIVTLRGVEQARLVERLFGQPGVEQAGRGVVEEAQAVRGGGVDDVGQRLWGEGIGEVVVEQDMVRVAGELGGDSTQRGEQRQVVLARAGEVAEEAERRFAAGVRVDDALDRVERHRTQDQPVMAARQRVVADEGDAVGRQQPADQRKHRLLNRRRHPCVDAVRDDIVERALEGAGGVEDVGDLDANVGEPRRRGDRPAAGDRGRCQVNVEELRARQALCHREQVHRVPATDVEHAGGGGRRRVQAVKARDRGEMIGMARRERAGGIGDVVVDGGAGRRRAHASAVR